MCRWKRTKMLVGVSLELVALCSKGWGTSLACPLLSQPSLGTGIAPSSSEYSESVPGWGGEFAWNSCSLKMLCPHLTVREQCVCLAVQLGTPLLCR